MNISEQSGLNQDNSYITTHLDKDESRHWFQLQEKKEVDKYNLTDSEDYINTKRELFSNVILSGLFLIPVIIAYYYTFIYNKSAGNNSFIVYILLALFGFNFILSVIKFVKQVKKPTPDTVPGLFLDKYYEAGRKMDKPHNDYYVILNVGKTNVVANVTKEIYDKSNSSNILWMYENSGKLNAIKPTRDCSPHEITQIMSRYKTSDTKGNADPTSINEHRKLNVHQSRELIKSKHSNNSLSRKIESSEGNEGALIRERNILNKMFIFFFVMTIVPNLGVVVAIAIFGFMPIPALFFIVINCINLFLFYSKLRINKSKIGVVLEGVVLEKKERVLRNVNTRLSNNQNVLFVKVDNNILEIYVDNEEYFDVEINDEVFIYNYVENEDTIRVIKQV